MLKEFSEFIKKGNVVDLAVGIVIGSSFSNIVNSLVNDIIMPFVGVLIGGIDFTELKITVGETSINYGAFIQNVVDFLIIAFAVFLFIKLFNRIRDDANKRIEKFETEIKKIEKKTKKTSRTK